ncbi:MAG: hypothetical protein JXR76_14975 [Deltaproteobacteria bacterium]|nr:hypothetical protein [Deltaproteobacteria bacterium]
MASILTGKHHHSDYDQTVRKCNATANNTYSSVPLQHIVDGVIKDSLMRKRSPHGLVDESPVFHSVFGDAPSTATNSTVELQHLIHFLSDTSNTHH